MRRRDGRRSGVALLVALGLLVLVAAAGAALQARTAELARAAVADRERLASHWAAEGAIERARWELSRDPNWAGGSFRVGAHEAAVHRDGNALRVRAGSTRIEVTFRQRGALPSVESWRERE